MCCRYYFAKETNRIIKSLVEYSQPDVDWSRAGDVRPSDKATIITGRKPGLVAEEMRWGFPSTQSNQLLINARAESALEKKTFSESILRRRCIIPAQHFYEWDRDKNKATFSWDESPALFMAGFFNRFADGDRFVVVTTEANDSMRAVHDRMPLIFAADEIDEWIYGDNLVREYLQKESPMLTKIQEYEQLSLF